MASPDGGRRSLGSTRSTAVDGPSARTARSRRPSAPTQALTAGWGAPAPCGGATSAARPWRRAGAEADRRARPARPRPRRGRRCGGRGSGRGRGAARRRRPASVAARAKAARSTRTPWGRRDSMVLLRTRTRPLRGCAGGSCQGEKGRLPEASAWTPASRARQPVDGRRRGRSTESGDPSGSTVSTSPDAASRLSMSHRRRDRSRPRFGGGAEHNPCSDGSSRKHLVERAHLAIPPDPSGDLARGSAGRCRGAHRSPRSGRTGRARGLVVLLHPPGRAARARPPRPRQAVSATCSRITRCG